MAHPLFLFPYRLLHLLLAVDLCRWHQTVVCRWQSLSSMSMMTMTSIAMRVSMLNRSSKIFPLSDGWVLKNPSLEGEEVSQDLQRVLDYCYA